MSWAPGATITQENWFGGHPVTVFAVTVVHDDDDRLVLYTAAGSTRADSTMRDRQAVDLEERMRVYTRAEPDPFEERGVRSHVLTINSPGAHSSVWLFWSSGWEFLRWYVNLQPPFERTPSGIVVGRERPEYLLDLVVEPDGRWAWKDRDEFDTACAAGLLDDDDRHDALAEGEPMIGRIESWSTPFDEPWPAWRPDASWHVPHIAVTGPRSWEVSRTGPGQPRRSAPATRSSSSSP